MTVFLVNTLVTGARFEIVSLVHDELVQYLRSCCVGTFPNLPHLGRFSFRKDPGILLSAVASTMSVSPAFKALYYAHIPFCIPIPFHRTASVCRLGVSLSRRAKWDTKWRHSSETNIPTSML